MNYSYKVEAYEFGEKCGRNNNQSSDIQFHLNSSKYEDKQNCDAKEAPEMNYSYKVEAYEFDDKCGRINNQSTDIQFHLNSSKYEDKPWKKLEIRRRILLL
ncbi:tektin-4-like isoform X2 [Xenopus laevis]|uniref:Tektin-4-like isoform X2 n=1 Tax=Xenopus laevis TaxID=8355 RepID=A0A8J1LU84_XENLA|nr:tektin-4-like isoform X2 [Xenopus laevis]